jgi:16S rRNA (cytidine1402-2'-O)-methyltransferase
MTYRGVEALKAADVIACEDKRVSRVLLQHYGITTPMMSYHEHNAASQREVILQRLQAGETVALITDAGTPLISDPGYKLVRDVREAGYGVEPLPGACAAVVAMSGAGLPSDCFFFAGFLPNKQQAREQRLKALLKRQETVLCYESPKRIVATLEQVAQLAPERDICVARELTKRHEEWLNGTAAEIAQTLSAREQVRGEIVLLLAPAEEDVPQAEDVDALLKRLLAEYSVKEAAKEAAEQTGLSRSELYNRALELRG